MKKTKNIVCLGGGTGTVNLLKGLKAYYPHITTVLSMADTGGSGGRLRRLYNIPLGDLVTCMSALTTDTEKKIAELLTYRFPGERYGEDQDIGGHKLGNLIMIALTQITNDFSEATKLFQKIFSIEGTFLPATQDQVNISAVTVDGMEIVGEEKIDLGQYHGTRTLEKVFLHPMNPQVGDGVIAAITNADVVLCGPGDLYTTLLPVLIVPAISEAIKQTKAKKIFIINVANKPFETRGYSIADFINAVIKHIGSFPFHQIIINNNFTIPIPPQYNYTYVQKDGKPVPEKLTIIEKDLVDVSFPLYHDTKKLAKVVVDHI